MWCDFFIKQKITKKQRQKNSNNWKNKEGESMQLVCSRKQKVTKNKRKWKKYNFWKSSKTLEITTMRENKRKPATMQVFSIMVEMRGVEPLSITQFTQTSPSAVYY